MISAHGSHCLIARVRIRSRTVAEAINNSATSHDHGGEGQFTVDTARERAAAAH